MAQEWVDYRAVKAAVSFEQVFARYGLEATTKGEELRLRCPFHEDTKPSLSANSAKGGFKCFGCSAKGNIITFVERMEHVSFRDAALLLQEWFNLTAEKPQAPGAKTTQPPPLEEGREEHAKEKEPLTNPPLTFTLQHLDTEHPYLTQRDLTTGTIAHFGIGHHSGKGMMAGRIAIPIHNEHGELVAYAGRWPADDGWPEGEDKYKMPSREKGFRKSHLIFNLHRATEVATDHGLILVEGFFDCMKLWQAGFHNVVALMGTDFHEKQEALIAAAVGPQGRIALMFDEDPAGWRCREEALSRLSSKVYVKVIGLGEEGMQPDKMSAEAIRRSLT